MGQITAFTWTPLLASHLGGGSSQEQVFIDWEKEFLLGLCAWASSYGQVVDTGCYPSPLQG
jgi:hypothetical protein